MSFPTSKDIYIEVNGLRLAAAQAYKAKTSRESRPVEAFGSPEPVGTVGGRLRYLLELSHVMLCGGSQTDFHAIDDFNVVIVKPGRKLIYSGCQWSSIEESVELGGLVYERVGIVARSRMEVAV